MAIAMFQSSEVGVDMVKVDTKQMRLAHMRRRVTAWARAVNNLIETGRALAWKVMLTYAEVDGWRRNHIKDFMRRCRDEWGAALLAYAWVAELQVRGAVHYHLCLVLEPGTEVPKFDEAGWWKHGITGRGRLKSVSGQYLMKYGQKSAQKDGEFPKGLRLFATVIRCDVEPLDFFYFKLAAVSSCVMALVVEWLARAAVNSLPDKMFAFGEDGWRWGPIKGGGWLVRWRNLWQVVESGWTYYGLENASNHRVGGTYHYS